MKIFFHKKFVKKFRKLSPKIQEAFDNRLNIFKKNKFNQILNNHSVSKTYPTKRSINVTGDYRAIFKDEDNVITFATIGTHSELYK